MSSETKRKAGDGNLMASLIASPKSYNKYDISYTRWPGKVNINKNRVLEICDL